MSNNERYSKVFMEAFEVGNDQLCDLEYQGIEAWDSVGHMTLIGMIEDEFDIEMDTDDIIDLNSFNKGKELLSSHYGIEFA